MRKGSFFLLLITIFQTGHPAAAAVTTASLGFGYDGGTAATAEVTVGRFLDGNATEFRLSATHATRPSGNAGDARKIFINDATSGTPEKSGDAWVLRADLAVPFRRIGTGSLSIFGGPRYSLYDAHFRYVGGNEEFDVRSDQWGLGGGLDVAWLLSGRTSLRLVGGVDTYLASSLRGHDTIYVPDGENVNPRGDYGYDDADEAIDQPRLVGRFLVGVRVRLGR